MESAGRNSRSCLPAANGLVFVTAFSTREVMRSFLTQISWETEVWVAEDPEHLIHFNGERFLGPYPDVMPKVIEWRWVQLEAIVWVRQHRTESPRNRLSRPKTV
jgi:hypothetical protein